MFEADWRYSSGAGSAAGRGNARARNGASASSVTTQGEIVVEKFFPRKGPSGWYSQAWTSRADQSLTRQQPKDLALRFVGWGSARRGVPAPRCKQPRAPPRSPDAASGRTVAARRDPAASVLCGSADSRPTRDHDGGAATMIARSGHGLVVRKEGAYQGGTSDPRFVA